MKSLVMALFSACFLSCASKPVSTTEETPPATPVATAAPSLETLAVLNDPVKNEYSSTLFYVVDGQVRKLGKDPSCEKVMVMATSKRKTIECVSMNNEMIPVGSVSNKQVGQQNDQIAYSVKWAKNVEVVETKNTRGSTFSLRVKK
ncbi:MAG: hypothetical protein AB7O96_17920 [Pseudobdellovibrionaceae bacterium]